MKRTSLLFLCLLATLALAQEPESVKEKRMQWFGDAKLGIFIHYGIYSVAGISESWAFYNDYLTHEDYMAQLKGFTASQYEPLAWASLIKQSGARYAVLTAKHCDGVALWNTRQNDLSVVKKTPAGRDLVTPYCRAMRNVGLKVGLYYSMLDWSHPDYPHFTKNKDRYDIENEPERWARFLKFQRGQIEELARSFRPDLFWFDADWDYTAEQWKAEETRELIAQWLPHVIVNSRINGYGDYDTPEQGVPITKPEARWWELCMTINDTWGYQWNDRNFKSPNQVIRIFVDCISMGGNLLLDVGPKEDGTIPAEQVNILKELGRWTKKHQAAIYGTRAGVSKDYYHGPSALSKDSTTLFLFMTSQPSGPVMIKGLNNKILQAWALGKGTKLETKVMMKQTWSPVPGIAYITVPKDVLDPHVTVLAVKLEGPLSLYQPPAK